jgi:Helicase associated domain
MDASRRQRLESLAGWSWHPFSDFWEKGFSHLQAFSQREGHCRVPRFYKTDDGYTLGYWVSGERNAKDTMEPDRRQRLEALPGWSWDPLSDQWEKGFSHLKQYSDREGHCRVSRFYKSDDGFRLGLWVNNQRVAKESMQYDRRQR